MRYTIRQFRNLAGILMFSGLAFAWTGCPTPTPQNEGVILDGGFSESPDQKIPLIQCPTNASCVFIEHKDVRSCALMVHAKTKTSVGNIEFSENVIGRSKHQDGKLGLVFIWQKHEALGASIPLLAIHPPKGTPAGTWVLQKATCYDAKGNPVESPKLRLEMK